MDTHIVMKTNLNQCNITLNWEINNWNTNFTEICSKTYRFPGTNDNYYFFFNLDALSITSLAGANGQFLIGLCSDNKSSSSTPKVISCSLRGKDANPIYKFNVYASSYYKKTNHRVLSLMMSSNSFIANPSLLTPYIVDKSLTVDIKLQYHLVDNVVGTNLNEGLSNSPKELLKNYHLLYEKQELCDVTFLFIDNEEIKAHTFVLGVVSPYFLSMFTQDTKESKDRLVDYSNDPDVTIDIFRGFLDYIYGIKKIQVLDDMIYELLVLSDKFNVETLKKDCEEYLAQKINDENVAKILYSANKYNFTFLKEAALKYAKKDLSVVGKSTEFELICEDKSLMSELLLKNV